ncbi:amino acid adenylation domain-containing protein [Peribacillus simplex]|uniref:amino acid adenylation domain-containing protein n=1 Tax=Peribacillus simplex TaxID=1478 RepID=UPI003D2CD983
MEKKQYFETSSAQRRLFIQQQLNLKSTSYNLPAVFKIEGKLDIERLVLATDGLIQRHESLRTIFETDLENNDISQIVLPDISFKLETLEAEKGQLHELLERMVKPFQLEQGPLFRLKLIHVSDGSRYLFFDIHHIIADGISIQNIIKEIVLLYNGIELPSVDVQYVDYVMWQNDLFKEQELSRQENYWVEQFHDEIPVLDLQTDFVRPAQNSGVGRNVHFHLEEPVIRQLKELALRENATLFMVLLSLYTVMLHRYTSQTDMVVGTPIAGRRHEELESVIGMFVNTLAIRVKPQGDMTFRQLLTEVKQTTLAAYDNQDYPLDQLVEKLSIDRVSDRHPMFDTMFVLQNMNTADVEFNGLRFQPYELETSSAKFDLTLELTEKDGMIGGKLEYSADLFQNQSIERMAKHFTVLAEQVATYPDAGLHQLDIMSLEEKKVILEDFNDSYSDFPMLTLAQLFEEQADLHPDHLAVLYGKQTCTYRELNEKANKLARTLQTKGISSGKAVGIMAERSLELIIGILAVSKAGAAYMPIEPDYPALRISHMLEDSGSQLLLVQGNPPAVVADSLQIMDLRNPALYGGESHDLEASSDSDSTAIIIFTSGTTGRPKGVMIRHRGVSRLVKQTNYVELNQHTRILQTCALGFDVFTFEIWAPLLNGGRLYLIEKETYLDAERLKPFLLEQEINMIVPTTALFNHLLNQDPTIFNNLETIIVGGEVMSPQHVSLLLHQDTNVNIKNGYGPAECTTYSNFYDVTSIEKSSIPIGKPISNTSCYVLDSYLQPVPVGVAGELFLGGDGLAAGYANRPELTDEKFITVPSLQGKRVYRTGDLVKWQSDGNLIYLGRRDDQLKIRGYRIELEEIKQQILSLPGILESVVVPVRKTEKDIKLCSYYTAEITINAEEMRSSLLQKLPEFMVPEIYMQLEKMPLSANNKINKKELPLPEFISSDNSTINGFESEMERCMAVVWQDVLGMEGIGVNDNFFALGGHSLKATLTVAKLRKKLEVDIGLNDLFANPTIRSLAESIRSKRKSGIPELKIVEKRESYPATSQQTRMYIAEKLKRAPDTSHNITDLHWIEGKIDIEKLKMVFQQLINRHDSLRMSYHRTADGVMFKVEENSEFQIEQMIGSEEQVPEIVEKFVRPYDLSKFPLFRIGIVTVSEKKQLLVFDIHHSISDGFSLGLLAKEFIHLFHGGELPELDYQYKDYAAWQQSFNKTDDWEQQELFWLDVLKGRLPVLNLPLDFPRPPEKGYEGELLEFQISEELTGQLKQLAMEENTTLYVVLLTAYYTLLYKYSGSEDIIIGAPVAGRNQAEIQQVFGLFVNTLTLRNYPKRSKTFREFLKEVRGNTIQAFEHQDYQLDPLLEKLDIRSSSNRNPLFDTIFVLQNMDVPPIDLEGLRFTPYIHQRNTSIMDILLIASEESNRLNFVFEYSTRLFRRETIERMEVHFAKLLKELVDGGVEQTLMQLRVDHDEVSEMEHPTNGYLTDTFSF